MQGRVLRAQSGFFWVQTEQGILECKLRGRLKKYRYTSDIVVIGDEVEVAQVAPGEGAIEAVAERRSRFSRRQPGPRGQWKEDVLIANLDQVVLIFSCANPPVNPRLLDRFLVIAEYNDIEAIVVANKIDLVGREESQRLFEIYEHIGYRVLYVSAHNNEGTDALRERLTGCISVLTGPSGVGKSSLLNSIQPGLQIHTSAVSETLHKGRHTTVVSELHPLAGSETSFVADTPGIRELAGWQIPDEDLAWCFPEMRPYLGGCAFNDCTHIHEPGCAIRDAAEAGNITPQRYDSYVRQMMKAER